MIETPEEFIKRMSGGVVRKTYSYQDTINWMRLYDEYKNDWE